MAGIWQPIPGPWGIAVFAYRYARRHMADRRFTFGVGKVEILGGFTSAVVLGVVALLMAWESATRLLNPLPISFDDAMIVAVLGLIVNLVSAWLLHDGHANNHSNHHLHHNGECQDHNLRAAYIHVLADALTSVLAIVALFCGKIFGWIWMDAAMGIVGAVVIGRWAIGLLRDTGRILLDSKIGNEKSEEIRRSIEGDSDNRIVDLHIWWVGPQHLGAIVSLVTHHPKLPDYYKALLDHMGDLAHLTIEVNACDGEPCLPVSKG